MVAHKKTNVTAITTST